MIRKYMLNILIVMAFLFTLPILTVAQSESSWTYSEGWWEVYSVSETDLLETDSGILFPKNADDGRLRLYSRATTELNAKANRHGITLTARILDARTRTVLAENSQYGFYTNENTHLVVTASHEIKPSEKREGASPFQIDNIQITHCPEDPGGGTTTPGGQFGISFLRYDYDHVDPFGKKWFVHYGNHCSGNCTNCPTTCGNVSWMREYWRVRCIGHNCSVGSRVALTIPWGPLGCSAIGGLGINHASWNTTCWDMSLN